MQVEFLILIVADYNIACGESDRSVCCLVWQAKLHSDTVVPLLGSLLSTWFLGGGKKKLLDGMPDDAL